MESIQKKNILMVLDTLICGSLNLDEKIQTDQKFMTVLHYACIYGNTMILEALIQNGANLSSVDDQNLKPIDLADFLKKDDITSYLSSKMNGDINISVKK